MCGSVSGSVPTTVGSRYGDPRGDGGLQPHQTTHTDITAEHALELDLIAFSRRVKAIESALRQPLAEAVAA